MDDLVESGSLLLEEDEARGIAGSIFGQAWLVQLT